MDQNTPPIQEEPVGKIIPINLTKEMEQSFLDYSKLAQKLSVSTEKEKPVENRALTLILLR